MPLRQLVQSLFPQAHNIGDDLLELAIEKLGVGMALG